MAQPDHIDQRALGRVEAEGQTVADRDFDKIVVSRRGIGASIEAPGQLFWIPFVAIAIEALR